MPDFCVTGKKGNGKTLSMIDLIKRHILTGRPVATNLDIYLEQLTDPQDKTARIIRLPDMPKAAELEALGLGNPTPDESMNGALILDEMSIWMNTRDYQVNGGERKALLDYLALARKRGWDVYYLSQSLGQLDKQLRESYAEHVVYCRRMDRLGVPFLGFFYKIIFGKPLRMPRIHHAIVKYGTDRNAQTSDTWTYRGCQYFKSYNTRQIFRADYPHGSYSYLPAYWLTYKSHSQRNGEFYMRMTKIIWRRWSRVRAFCFGALFVLFLFLFVAVYSGDLEAQEQKPAVVQVQPITESDKEFLKSLKIISIANFPDRAPLYKLKSFDKHLDTNDLIDMGYKLTFSGKTLTVSKGDHSEKIYF